MPAISAEEAAHAHARATVAGDIGTIILSMTPDGLAKAMEVGNTTWNVAGYELSVEGEDGEDHLFRIRYETDTGPLALRYRFRDVEGDWKIVDVEREA
jgi:hypothetical protein